MNDEKYIFLTDAAEKKKTARAIRNTNRTGKGPIRFPSDYMTKKERDAMNGEVATYNLHRPMKWKEFMSMPMDLQKQYIEWLDQVFDVGDNTLASMFGVSQNTINLRRKTLGVQVGKRRGRKSKEQIIRWETFLREERQEVEAEQGEKQENAPQSSGICRTPQKEENPPKKESEIEKPFGVATGSFDAFASPAELAQMLSVIAGTDRRQYTVKFQ